MAKKRKEPEPDKVPPMEPVEEIETPEPKPETHELGVYSALMERGLTPDKFDHVEVKFLFGDNYRVNCYKENRITKSHFISYGTKEGIYYCNPEIYNENESKNQLH